MSDGSIVVDNGDVGFTLKAGRKTGEYLWKYTIIQYPELTRVKDKSSLDQGEGIRLFGRLSKLTRTYSPLQIKSSAMDGGAAIVITSDDKTVTFTQPETVWQLKDSTLTKVRDRKGVDSGRNR